MSSIEFHFDFGSPNAYLSHLAIPQIEERTGVKFHYVPVLLGGVFKATNNVSPAVSMQGISNKPEYAQIETARFLKKYGVPAYTFNPHFPVNTLKIMRGAIYAQKAGIFDQYVEEIYRHMWNAPKKMDELDIIEAAFIESGLPADDILAGMNDAEVKAELISNTEASVARGTFGSPTFFVGDEIYFGKDKLVDVEEAIVELS
ncbi:MAG: 2-hydroxychromene-2-carboxylate isomerase [Flavobacterium sp.]|jgi:2-hydroxychromene-2-carboxylate isomerase